MLEEKTNRPPNSGGESWIEKQITCLDHGFVKLVDFMGNDAEIARAARVSYGRGTKKVREDEALIRYLLRNKHTSPFEMVEIKFHCKMPIFVARQWIRHRTANVNEYSGRFSIMSDKFYVPKPEVLKKQSEENKQGRDEDLSDEQKQRVLELLTTDFGRVYDDYKELTEIGLAKELARIGLSVANYTEWFWKIDLHNLFHFLKLRLDPHAQYEIRVYAEAIAQIIKDLCPASYQAFEDYILNSVSFSRQEVEWIRKIVSGTFSISDDYAKEHTPFENEKGSKMMRETNDFIKKLRKIGF
ncbi:MAG: thymidylate synthase (FAD) [Parcubacteria group bacterium LiPW_41]|nr:MAG: thymidylate synthase (FAD) [Parcubacteria group bacterium LiPW_41]